MEEILRINTPTRYTPTHPKSVVKMTATTPLPSSLKLEYFDIQGPAEKIRLALSIGKVPFEDRRIKFDEWQQLKATMPFGKVPVLTIDGEDTRVTQSDALLRYAGRLANANGVELYPQGGMAQLRTDEMVSFVDEMAILGRRDSTSGCLRKISGIPRMILGKARRSIKKQPSLRERGGLMTIFQYI